MELGGRKRMMDDKDSKSSLKRVFSDVSESECLPDQTHIEDYFKQKKFVAGDAAKPVSVGPSGLCGYSIRNSLASDVNSGYRQELISRTHPSCSYDGKFLVNDQNDTFQKLQDPCQFPVPRALFTHAQHGTFIANTEPADLHYTVGDRKLGRTHDIMSKTKPDFQYAGCDYKMKYGDLMANTEPTNYQHTIWNYEMGRPPYTVETMGMPCPSTWSGGMRYPVHVQSDPVQCKTESGSSSIDTGCSSEPFIQSHIPCYPTLSNVKSELREQNQFHEIASQFGSSEIMPLISFPYPQTVALSSHYQSLTSSLTDKSAHMQSPFEGQNVLKTPSIPYGMNHFSGVSSWQKFCTDLAIIKNGKNCYEEQNKLAGVQIEKPDKHQSDDSNTDQNTLKKFWIKSQRGIFQFVPKSLPLSIADTFILVEKSQCEELGEVTLPSKVGYVYNPLEYAFETHYDFVHKFCNSKRKVLFLGMNPGPWGMSQNGVPFGEARVVREWLQITGTVVKPEPENPNRRVSGLQCARSEVSGSRFWGLFQNVCGTPETFFTNCVVYNMCPLAFMSDTGKNITPPQIEISIRKRINAISDKALLKVLQIYNVSSIVGVGLFASSRARAVLSSAGIEDVRVESIAHPSPLNVAANRGWSGIVTKQLQDVQLLDIVTNTCNVSN